MGIYITVEQIKQLSKDKALLTVVVEAKTKEEEALTNVINMLKEKPIKHWNIEPYLAIAKPLLKMKGGL
jgi:hypothetical protein